MDLLLARQNLEAVAPGVAIWLVPVVHGLREFTLVRALASLVRIVNQASDLVSLVSLVCAVALGAIRCGVMVR